MVTDDFASIQHSIRLFWLQNWWLQTILQVFSTQFVCFDSKIDDYRRFCRYSTLNSSVSTPKSMVTDDFPGIQHPIRLFRLQNQWLQTILQAFRTPHTNEIEQNWSQRGFP